jgi:hypothetical protein
MTVLVINDMGLPLQKGNLMFVILYGIRFTFEKKSTRNCFVFNDNLMFYNIQKHAKWRAFSYPIRSKVSDSLDFLE